MNIATPVIISLSDPWGLGEAIQWVPLTGNVVEVSDEDPNHVLVELRAPILWDGAEYSYISAAPRYEGGSLDSAQSGDKVYCTMTALAEDREKVIERFRSKRYLRGLALIGDVEIARSERESDFKNDT